MSQSKETQKVDDQLQQQLTYLNLPFIQKNYEDFAAQATAAQWPHVAYLSRLIGGEAAARQDRARERRIQQARFIPSLSSETFSPGRDCETRATLLLSHSKNSLKCRPLSFNGSRFGDNVAKLARSHPAPTPIVKTVSFPLFTRSATTTAAVS